MGNYLFRCFCSCCMNSTEEYKPLVQQKSVYYTENMQTNKFVKCKFDLDSNAYDDIPDELRHELRMLNAMLSGMENIPIKSDQNESGYQQLPTDEEKIVVEQAKDIVHFNAYDDVNINNDLLLIFGYVRNVQNYLSSDIAHYIVPQTVINIICNYCQKPNQSIFKIRLSFVKDKAVMCVDTAQNIACNVKQMWVNGSSLFFLSPNDHIYVSGSNTRGKLGINSSTDWQSILNIKPQTTTFYQKHTFRAISSSSCSAQHTIAITLNNEIYGFGYNGYHRQFGVENPSVKNSYTAKGIIDSRVEVFWPTLIDIDIKYKIIDIRVGYEHSLFLTSNGKVFGCGSNIEKQLGIKNKYSVKRIQLIESLSNDTIIKIRCGRCFSLVLTNNGILKGFGKNDKGQLGTGKVQLGLWSGCAGPIIVAVADHEPKITTIECGSAHSCCLDEFGNIYCWGDNEQGQCGQYRDEYDSYTYSLGDNYKNTIHAHSIPKPICVKLKGIKILNIACGSNYTVAMDNEMNLYAFGECDRDLGNSNMGWNSNKWVDVKKEFSRIHVAQYSEFQNLIDRKKIIDIKAGGFGDVYLCVANH